MDLGSATARWTIAVVFARLGPRLMARGPRLGRQAHPPAPVSSQPMAIFPLRTFGDPVLRTVTTPVVEIDASVEKLVADLTETMYDAPGVGLAANQIGVSRAVAVFDAQDGEGARVLINPEIVETGGEWVYEEGCLSVPGHFWSITRPEFVRVTSLNLEGEQVEYSGEGLLGRVLLHEIGHLNGELLIDHLEKSVQKSALRELRLEALGLVEYE